MKNGKFYRIILGFFNLPKAQFRMPVCHSESGGCLAMSLLGGGGGGYYHLVDRGQRYC
jgi:hypothetical protein